MSSNRRKEDLRYNTIVDQDFFASWEPVKSSNNENENKSNETAENATNYENLPELTKSDQQNALIRSDDREDWLDPTKFSGRVVHQSKIRDASVPPYVIPAERIENASDNSNQGIVTRKFTVLPPSVGYRGFCNVSDLTDLQRQPWRRRLKGESKSQVKGSPVKEYINSEGRKVKIMRLPDEAPPKKLKKVQVEDTGTSSVKNDLDEFEPLKRLELASSKKIALKMTSPKQTDKLRKESSAHDTVSSISPKNKSKASYGAVSNTISPGGLAKRQCVDVQKELFRDPAQERAVNTFKAQRKMNAAVPAKRYKQQELLRKKDGRTQSMSVEDNNEVEENCAGDNAEEGPEDILKDLESVKAKLAKLSEEIEGGNKENIEINKSEKISDNCGVEIQSALESQVQDQSIVFPSSKTQGDVDSLLDLKSDHQDKNKHSKNQVKESVDNLTKTNSDKKEKDRKAAKEYMRIKKAQWKEQQAREQDKKRMEIEEKQLKLKQLQETRVKLLKQSIKKKSAAVEKPNWKGPIHESSSPPPVPAKATTSLTEQVMMSRKKSSKKSLAVSSIQISDTARQNVEETQQMPNNDDLLTEIEKNTFDCEELKPITGIQINTESPGKKAADCVSAENIGNVDLSAIPEFCGELDQKLLGGSRSVNSKLSIVDESKDANKFVEAMNTEMKRLLKEFKLIREKSFQNEKKRTKRTRQTITDTGEVNSGNLPQSTNVDMLLPCTSSAVGNAGAFTGGNQGGGEHVESSDDHPQSTTQDESLSGGPLNELTDFELPVDQTNLKVQQTNRTDLPLRTKFFASSTKGDKDAVVNEEKIVAPKFTFFNDDSNEPKWLKSFASQPNPFNFITVVESKMKIAARQDNIEHLNKSNLIGCNSKFLNNDVNSCEGISQENIVPKLKLLDEESSEPKWLKTFVAQPNPFNFMTALENKMKISAKQENIELLKQVNLQGSDKNFLSALQLQQGDVFLPSQLRTECEFHEPNLIDQAILSEDTDAPSIVSMVEENIEFQDLQPLTIEDLKLNLPLSLNSNTSSIKELSGSPRDHTLQEIYYKGSGSFMKSKSDTLPNSENAVQKTIPQSLFIPKSIQSFPTSLVCLSEEKINYPMSTKASSETLSENVIGSNQTFSLPETDFVSKASGSYNSSVVQTAGRSCSSSRSNLQTASNVDHQPLEFEELHRCESERRKKIKLSDFQENHKFLHNEPFEIGNVFSPDALFLQFKAELSKLEVFEASLAQVTATEHLRNLAINANNVSSMQREGINPEETSYNKSELFPGESGKEKDAVVLYENVNKPTVVTDYKKAKSIEGSDFVDGIISNKVDDAGASDIQITRVTSSEQLDQSLQSVASQSSVNLPSIDESVSLQVPSAINEEEISEEKSKMDDLTGTVDFNLNSMSSSATPRSVDRSSSYSDMRLSFTNQRSAAKYSLLIFDQLIKEQKLRSEQQQAAFKLREKALRDRTKAEFTLFEIQRISLREKGLEEQAKNIKKKQRGLLLKWRQDHDELIRQRNNEDLASQERIMMLLQQQNLVKMQMSTKNTLRKMKSAIATFTAGESFRKKSANSVGLPSTVPRCASMSSLPESSDNESRRGVHQNQKQLVKSQNRTTGDGGNEESDSSSKASDAALVKKSPSKQSLTYKGSVDGSDKTNSPSDQHDSIKWRELQPKKTRPRIVLDRSTSPFQLTPVESSGLDKQVVTTSVLFLTANSSDPIVSVADNTSKVISSIHSGQDHEISSIPEEITRSQSGSRVASSSRTGSVSQIQEELAEEELIDHTSINLQLLPSQYNSDNLDSPQSPATGSSYHTRNESTSPVPSSPHQTRNSGISNRQCRVSIKGPLTPQLPVGNCRTRKRCSSGSDDSIILSQNETFSEQSDLEVRLSALHEQLRQKKLEAEKLRREQKRAQRERLKTKEQSLIKQIQAYDAYIEQVRKDLEQDLDASAVPIMKPLIKQTRVSLRKPENVANKPAKEEKKTVVSDESVSEASSIETTIQSFGQIQSVKDIDNSIANTETSVREISSVEANETSDVKEETELASEKWIDGVNFFNDKTSDIEECLEENKGSAPDSLSNQVVSSENSILKAKHYLSDKIKSNSVCSNENIVTERGNEILDKHKTVGDSSDLESVKEYLNSNISERSTINENLDTDDSQDMIKTDENLDSCFSAKVILSDHKNVSEDFSIKSKTDEYIDSDNLSVKSLQSDDQNYDSVQEMISDREKSESMKSVNLKNDSIKSSSAVSDVPILHSKTSNHSFESDADISANETDVDNCLSEKIPSPGFDRVDKEINHKNDSNKLVSENTDLDENVYLHSAIVPSDLLNENTDKDIACHQSSITPSGSFSSEIATVSPEPVLSNSVKVVSDGERKCLIVEEEDDKVEKGIEDNDKDDKIIVPVLIELKSSPVLLNPEDSVESKSSAGTVESDLTNDVEKSHVTSDESFSNHEDDVSTSSKVDDVIKVFVTEKEKIIKANGVSDDKENIISENTVDNYTCTTKKEDKSDNVFSESNENDENLFSRKISHDNFCDKKNSRVDRITDKILSDLLKDSLSYSQKIFSDEQPINRYLKENLRLETPFITALKNEQERDIKNNLENIMENVLKKSIKEETDKMFKIYKKKFSPNPLSENKNKLQDQPFIAASSPKAQLSLLQVLNSDLSPPSKDETFIVHQSPPLNETSPKDSDSGDEKKLDAKGLWVDEEMGLGRTCKEAEELRLQQLQIEQEIQQLERASAGQIGYDDHIPSYYYLREIPNKPPPPYTPPGQACIPTSSQDVLGIVNTAIDYLYSAHSQGSDISKLQLPSKLQVLDDSPRSVYKRFLFDLIRQLILEAIDSGNDDKLLPWEKTAYKRKCWIPKKTDEITKRVVIDKVKVLFGFETRTIKENLIIRWSRKKRDKVDELLVRESQEEEQEWTDFSQDETVIKNKVTLAIWDSLLLETGTILQAAYNNKINRIRCLLDT